MEQYLTMKEGELKSGEEKTGKVFFLTFSQGQSNICRERAML